MICNDNANVSVTEGDFEYFTVLTCYDNVYTTAGDVQDLPTISRDDDNVSKYDDNDYMTADVQ